VPTRCQLDSAEIHAGTTDSMKQAGRFDLVVINPAPADTFFTRRMWGNGTPNMAHLVVNYRY
jgi:hypothetical protein